MIAPVTDPKYGLPIGLRQFMRHDRLPTRHAPVVPSPIVLETVLKISYPFINSSTHQSPITRLVHRHLLTLTEPVYAQDSRACRLVSDYSAKRKTKTCECMFRCGVESEAKNNAPSDSLLRTAHRQTEMIREEDVLKYAPGPPSFNKSHPCPLPDVIARVSVRV